MPSFISEDQIEQELVRRLRERHCFEVLNCHTADPDDEDDRSGRASKRDVILVDRVREAASRLNPRVPLAAIEEALERLTDRRRVSVIAITDGTVITLGDGGAFPVSVSPDALERAGNGNGKRIM
jgi:type I restriction enzyme, R subunit